MDKTKTPMERELEVIKMSAEAIRRRRRELMHRLNEAGFTQQRIAQIYGCSQPFVASEIAAYREQKVEQS